MRISKPNRPRKRRESEGPQEVAIGSAPSVQDSPNKRAKREEIFAREYIIDLNGSRAAVAAGYSAKGADVRAAELLGNRRVKDLIATLTKDRLEKLDISAERILRELARLGFSNMLDYLAPQEDGSVALDFSGLTREQAAAIQEIREDKTGGTGDGERKQIVRTTFKLADKTRALELLGKYRKLFTEKVELTMPEALVQRLLNGRKRASGK
jgi:phage terminase small subunit